MQYTFGPAACTILGILHPAIYMLLALLACLRELVLELAVNSAITTAL